VLGDNRPLRGWKGDLYEGGIRVPGFANWPGTLAPRNVTATLSGLDWLPTLAALTGAKAPPHADWEGVDVWPLLAGAATTAPDRALYWKTPREFALREGDWKLIEQRRKGNAPQLFNLASDPLEKTDRAAQEPDRVARLHALLQKEQARDGH